MARTYSPLVILIIFNAIFENIHAIPNVMSPIKTVEPNRRNNLADDSFMEHKDVLLNILESKLKEIREKKKKKSDHEEHAEPKIPKCEILAKNVNVKLKSNGISALGDIDVQLKYGKFGNSTLNLDATGVSNVGKAQVNLGVGDGNLNIPGLSGLFQGINNCDQIQSDNAVSDSNTGESRKSELLHSDNNIEAAKDNVTESKVDVVNVTDSTVASTGTVPGVTEVSQNGGNATDIESMKISSTTAVFANASSSIESRRSETSSTVAVKVN